MGWQQIAAPVIDAPARITIVSTDNPNFSVPVSRLAALAVSTARIRTSPRRRRMTSGASRYASARCEAFTRAISRTVALYNARKSNRR